MAKEAEKDSRLMRSAAPATPGGWRSPLRGRAHVNDEHVISLRR